MLQQWTRQMAFFSSSLQLRAQRQQVLASNIANADTPGFVARDFDFAHALRGATGGGQAGGTATALPQAPSPVLGTGALAPSGGLATTDARHLGRDGGVGGDGHDPKLGYSVQTQPSVDNNSVDLDQQRANFTDNAIRYESTLRFINGHVKTMLAAIQGQ